MNNRGRFNSVVTLCRFFRFIFVRFHSFSEADGSFFLFLFFFFPGAETGWVVPVSKWPHCSCYFFVAGRKSGQNETKVARDWEFSLTSFVLFQCLRTTQKRVCTMSQKAIGTPCILANVFAEDKRCISKNLGLAELCLSLVDGNMRISENVNQHCFKPRIHSLI